MSLSFPNIKLAAFFLIILLTGCGATSSINVITSKETSKPFSKILIVYVEGAIELNSLDSATYNICIKDNFEDTSITQMRNTTEIKFAEELSTSQTTAVKYSALFDSSFNSYQDFVTMLDSLNVEAVLLINQVSYEHKNYCS